MSASGPSIQIYGAGRIGLAVASLARRRRVPVVGIWNPRPLRPARARLSEGLPLTVAPDPEPVPADVWLVAVPDDAIVGTGERLARAVERSGGPRPGCAAHCAGAHPARLLDPLARTGIACGSWHPRQFRSTGA